MSTSKHLIQIITRLDLAALQQAISALSDSDDEKGKEKIELPEILSAFEKDFNESLPYIDILPPDKDFDAKLELLLEFYKTYNEQIYAALQKLETKRLQEMKHMQAAASLFFEEEEPAIQEHSASVLSSPMVVDTISMRLEDIIVDRVSRSTTAGKMDKVAIQGMISRIFTPDQQFSSGSSDDKVLLEQLYNPLMPQNIKETMNVLFEAILAILANDTIPFARKLENIFSLYKQYEPILKSATEHVLYSAEMSGKSGLLKNILLSVPEELISLEDFIRGKIKEGEEYFFAGEALKQQIIAAYLKMLFQYLGNKITFAVKELEHPHKEILEITIFQTLSKIFEENKEISSLRQMPNKDEKLIERFKMELRDKKGNTVLWKLKQERKNLQAKIKELLERVNELSAIAAREGKEEKYKPLQTEITLKAESPVEYIKLIDSLSAHKSSSFLSTLNPKSLKAVIVSDKNISQKIDEAKGIVDEIKRLQACARACDEASASMNSLQGDSATPEPTSKRTSSFLRLGKKPSLSPTSSTQSPVERKSRLRIGGGLTGNPTSSFASTSSAPVSQEPQVVSLANPHSAPAPMTISATTSSAPTSPWVSRSSKSSTPNSSGTTSPALFAPHRSPAPPPAVPEEQNVLESSNATNPSDEDDTTTAENKLKK